MTQDIRGRAEAAEEQFHIQHRLRERRPQDFGLEKFLKSQRPSVICMSSHLVADI